MNEERWEDITGTVLHVQEAGFCEVCDKRYWVRILPFGCQDYLVCEKCFALYNEE